MIKAQSTKSQELAKSSKITKVTHKNQYWCHTCQFRFIASLKPGVDQIFCPKCGDDFCQIFTKYSRPNHFEPYQKPPKSHPRKIPILTSQIVLMALAQYQYDAQTQKVREIKDQDVENLKVMITFQMSKQLQECMICKEQLEISNEALRCPCTHIFHIECLKQWLEYKNSCPKCRQPILKE